MVRVMTERKGQRMTRAMIREAARITGRQGGRANTPAQLAQRRAAIAVANERKRQKELKFERGQ